MSKKLEISEETKQEMVRLYRINLSVVLTAQELGIGKNKTRKVLKELGVLLSISDYAKMRVGDKNPFFGKKHSQENKDKHSEFMSTRLGKLNPNYKHGTYLRRPRDFKIAEFTPIRNKVFNRDNYTCVISGSKGGHLHAHHIIPYWVCPEAFLDEENIITVSTAIHFSYCHNGDWAKFNADLVSDKLLQKYSLSRERLNELADFHNKKSDAIVRSSDISKTEETDRNDQSK